MYVAFECVATYRIRHLLYSIYIKYICKYIHIYLFYTHTMLRCWGSRGQGFVLISSSSFSFVSSVHQCVSPSVRPSCRSVSPWKVLPSSCAIFVFFFYHSAWRWLWLQMMAPCFHLLPPLPSSPCSSPLPSPLCESFVCQSCQCRRPLDCIECGSICIVKALAWARLAGRQAVRLGQRARTRWRIRNVQYAGSRLAWRRSSSRSSSLFAANALPLRNK